MTYICKYYILKIFLITFKTKLFPLAGIESTPKNPDEKPVIAEHGSWDAYHLPSVVLCGVLCPRAANCDQIFEFMIDDQKFIGYPTTVSHKNNPIANSMGDSILIPTPVSSTAKLTRSTSSGQFNDQNTDGSSLKMSQDTITRRTESISSDILTSSNGSKPSLRESQYLGTRLGYKKGKKKTLRL